MADEYEEQNKRISERMGRIGRKIMIMSGKGGVGKTSMTVNLASALKNMGCSVGVLDTDIHGPNTARMFGCEGSELLSDDGVSFNPVITPSGIKLMSISFALESADTPVIWRGMMKNTAIRQFLADTNWGDLDYLLIDTPPGTGDEQLTVVQAIGDMTGSVIVTTPQEVAVTDARRTVNFSEQIGMSVIGVIENMSGMVCPHCGGITDIFGSGGGKKMAEDMGIPFLGSVPIDVGFAGAEDQGIEWVSGDSPSARSMREIAMRIHISETAKKAKKSFLGTEFCSPEACSACGENCPSRSGNES